MESILMTWLHFSQAGRQLLHWVSWPTGAEASSNMASETEMGQTEKPVYKKIIEYKKKIALGRESITISLNLSRK